MAQTASVGPRGSLLSLLPNAVLCGVLLPMLSHRSLCSLSRTCRALRLACTSAHTLWSRVSLPASRSSVLALARSGRPVRSLTLTRPMLGALVPPDDVATLVFALSQTLESFCCDLPLAGEPVPRAETPPASSPCSGMFGSPMWRSPRDGGSFACVVAYLATCPRLRSLRLCCPVDSETLGALHALARTRGAELDMLALRAGVQKRRDDEALSSEAAFGLWECPAGVRALRTISLVNLQSGALAPLLRGPGSMPSLRELRGVRIQGGENAGRVLEAIASACPQLRAISAPDVGPEEILRHVRSLHDVGAELGCSRVRLALRGGADEPEFALQSLHLSLCGDRCPHAADVARLLSLCPSLLRLRLSLGTCPAPIMRAVAGLELLAQLEVDCGLDDAGIAALGASKARLRRLSVHAERATSLVALPLCSELRGLEVSGILSDDDCSAIAARAIWLQELVLVSESSEASADESAMLLLLNGCRRLHSLTLVGNGEQLRSLPPLAEDEVPRCLVALISDPQMPQSVDEIPREALGHLWRLQMPPEGLRELLPELGAAKRLNTVVVTREELLEEDASEFFGLLCKKLPRWVKGLVFSSVYDPPYWFLESLRVSHPQMEVRWMDKEEDVRVA